MEKNQTKPKDVCEKIFRAITFGPAITTIRRLSNRTPSPATVRSTPHRPKPSDKQGSESVPIKFDYTTKTKPITIHTNGGHQAVVPLMAQQAKTPKPSTADHTVVQSGNGKLNVSGIQHQAKKEDGKKATTQQHYDDKFTAFIHETREKIMTRDHGGHPGKVVDHGHGSNARKDHQFSDYINQTKRKIKSTLTIKDRNESFFK